MNGILEKLTHSELQQLSVVLSAYRSIRGKRRDHIAYVSMPVSTGRKYYEVLHKHRVKTPEELDRKLGPGAFKELVIEPNIEAGTKLADRLGAEKELLFIAPSVFNASPWHWSQSAYMSLWYNVIAGVAGSLFMADGWEYATGGSKEAFFAFCWQWRWIRPVNKEDSVQKFGLQDLFSGLDRQAEMRLFDELANLRLQDCGSCEVRIDEALEQMVGAIGHIQRMGFQCPELLNSAWGLMQLPVLSLASLSWGDLPYNPITPRYEKARRKLYELAGKTFYR